MNPRLMGIDVAGLSRQETDELIVAAVRRIELLLDAQMPFSDQAGVVTPWARTGRETASLNN